MSRPCTQSFFDGLVKECVEDLEMGLEEGIADALAQAKSQGLTTDRLVLTSYSVVEEKLVVCHRASELAKRLLAGSEEAANFSIAESCLLVEDASTWSSVSQLLNETTPPGILALTTALFTGNPRLLTKPAAEALISRGEPALAALKAAASRSEDSRGILQSCGGCQHSVALLPASLALVRALLAEEDVDGGIPHTGERAKLMFEAGVVEKLAACADSPHFLAVLTAMSVRREYCDAVWAATSEIILSKLSEPSALKAVAALAGSEDVRASAAPRAVPMATEQLEKFPEQAALCLAALTLRCPPGLAAALKEETPAALTRALDRVADDAKAVRAISRAMRNLVSRDDKLREQTLMAIPSLQACLAKWPDSLVADDVRAALRDLGAEVQLKTPWMGEKGQIPR